VPFGIGKRKEKEEDSIDRARFLAAYPVRNPSVITRTDDKGQVELEIKLPKPSRWVRLIATPPEKKVVKLDSLGSFVWQRCDGAHRVRDIAEEVSKEFNLTGAESTASLAEFLRSLSKRGLIAFMVLEGETGSAGREGPAEEPQGEGGAKGGGSPPDVGQPRGGRPSAMPG